MIPEGSPRYNDLVDVIIQSVTGYEDVPQKDGSIVKEQIINSEGLWWKTNKIDSEKFAALAFEIKEFERMATEAFNNMCSSRAQQYSDQILNIGASLRSSIDAMSSQSRRDKHNARQTTLDTIGRNRVERITTLKDESAKGGISSFFGSKSRQEIDED